MCSYLTTFMCFQLLEEEEVEVPVSKEPAKEDTKMETDEAPSDTAAPSANETDVNMQDAKGTADAAGVENGVPESGDKPVQMETDTKVSDFCLHAIYMNCQNWWYSL